MPAHRKWETKGALTTVKTYWPYKRGGDFAEHCAAPDESERHAGREVKRGGDRSRRRCETHKLKTKFKTLVLTRYSEQKWLKTRVDRWVCKIAHARFG